MITYRLAFHKKSNGELKHYFEYELSPYTLSLFGTIDIRKTQKPVFYKLFDPFKDPTDFRMAEFAAVGGFLWHGKQMKFFLP